MSFFEGASQIHVTNSNFTDNSSRGLNAIHYLYQHITFSAIHDSEERYDPPKCHKNTRTTIINNIMAWIRKPQRKKNLLRLHGPAGAGKSAISQTIAELCQECGLLAATFFFSRDSQDRSSGKRLFATLAYQLATNIPALKDSIEEVLESNPDVVTKSMGVQLQKLILQPLARLGFTRDTASQCVIIIDGLDECCGDKQQLDILQFIFSALQHPHFPFCFIVASRPEPRIVAQLDSPQYQDKSWSINLNNRKDAKEDLRIVLKSGFADIHDNPIHTHSMTSIPKPWPNEYAIDRIVSRSSGQFVYASTVLKFIDDPDFEPTQQLKIILDITQRSHPSAFSDLDNLYSEILKRCRNPELMLDVLGYLIALIQSADAYAATWGRSLGTTSLPMVVDQLLALNPGDSSRSLRGLNSLISIFTPTVPGSEMTGIKFHHASFADFLRSKQRAGPFFIKVSAIHGKITRSCLRILRDFPKNNVTPAEYLVWVYAILFWCYHCSKSKFQTNLGKELHAFDVCNDWILTQTLPSPNINEAKLRDALVTLDIRELNGCPGQSRWSIGNPDIQSMATELGSVYAWLETQAKKQPLHAATLNTTAQRFSKAFDRGFTLHIAQTPDPDATRLFLGVLLSGETSERILNDFNFVLDHGLPAFLKPLGLFLYRWGIEGSRILSSDPSTSFPDILAGSESDCRIGIKSEPFRLFLEDPDSKAVINSNIHSTIALTFMRVASQAISKQWNPYDYTQVWTFSLERSEYFEELIELLPEVTEKYISSAHLRSGLRRHHVKSVLVYLKGCPRPLGELTTNWTSAPLWKDTWNHDAALGASHAALLYELAQTRRSLDDL